MTALLLLLLPVFVLDGYRLCTTTVPPPFGDVAITRIRVLLFRSVHARYSNKRYTI